MERRIYPTFLLLTLVATLSLAAPPNVINIDRVVDGDTMLTFKGQLQLLGVDAPKRKAIKKTDRCFAIEAREFVRTRIEDKLVKLSYDGHKKDKFGRMLAYVWYGPKYARLLNAEIIEQGYGFASDEYDFSRLREFEALEARARKAGRGMWAPGACDHYHQKTAPIKSDANGFCASKYSKYYHPCSCPTVKSIKIEELIHFNSEAKAKASGRKLHRCKK